MFHALTKGEMEEHFLSTARLAYFAIPLRRIQELSIPLPS